MKVSHQFNWKSTGSFPIGKIRINHTTNFFSIRFEYFLIAFRLATSIISTIVVPAWWNINTEYLSGRFDFNIMVVGKPFGGWFLHQATQITPQTPLAHSNWRVQLGFVNGAPTTRSICLYDAPSLAMIHAILGNEKCMCH